MSNIAIKIDNLSKRYRIGLQETRHETITSAAVSWLRSPLDNFRRLRRLSQFDELESDDILWALRDISFTVRQGEVIGIIGRNGAGKSTLLKILSRITPPSSGRITLNGRVASLLEVGTGFHPELTGRENVYLNGTILGMRKVEIDRKFDEIVDFSGVEKFIDTPVKRYSSGMRVRLAFSVAAHLEPEILLVDEVLAVGDAEFQQKSLGKMQDVAGQGRTVFFVSHNMQAIQNLCETVYLLERGRLIDYGKPLPTISRYLNTSTPLSIELPQQFGEELCLQEIAIRQDGHTIGEYIDNRKPFSIDLGYDLKKPVINLLLGFDFFSSNGAHLFRTYDLLARGFSQRPAGQHRSVYQVPANLFQSEHYYLELVIGIHRRYWLTRGDLRMRLQFDSPSVYDVDFPGLVQAPGNWEEK